MTKLRFRLVSALLVAGAGVWLLVRNQNQNKTQARLREENAVLRQESAQLVTDNAGFSNRLVQASGAPPEDQRMELLKLRGEVGVLKQQLAETSAQLARASAQANASASGRYWLAVEFNPKIVSKDEDALLKMEIAVCPDATFAVKTQDHEGNQFEVAGTMRQTTAEKFAFDGGKIQERMAGGSFGTGIEDLSVGQGGLTTGTVPWGMSIRPSLTKE